MNGLVYKGTIICLFILVLTGISQSADESAIINVMVDVGMPASPTPDQLTEAELDFIPIANMMSSSVSQFENLNWTIFLVEDASMGKRLYFANMALRPGIEMAMSGNHSDERLSTKSYEEQKAVLERSKKIIESLKTCGTNEVPAHGFKPQSFDQNEDTYKALDDLGIDYNAGFQAGIIFAPGHENDVWPYKVENHKFYAVPVSTATLSDELVPLDDRYARNKGISGSQWYDLLAGKLDGISGKDEPMVISLSTSVSGKGDYLEAFRKFIGYAKSKGANFVNTNDLVNMERSGMHVAPKVSKSSIYSNDTCPTCNSDSVDIKVTNGTIIV
jgi:hypothetical protein